MHRVNDDDLTLIIEFDINHLFAHSLNDLFGRKWLNSSIWDIDVTLIDTTTPGQSGSESDGHKRVLHFSQSSKPETSLSDGSVGWLVGWLVLRRINPFRVI